MKQNGLDWDKEDHGKNDGVLWIISIAQVIKEINSSNVRFNEAMCRHVAENRTDGIFGNYCTPIGDNNGFGQGLYAIPDQQERIDEIVNQSNGSLGALAKTPMEMEFGILLLFWLE